MNATAICKECGTPFTYTILGKAPECCCEKCSRRWHSKQYARGHTKIWRERVKAAGTQIKGDVMKRYGYKCAICGWQGVKNQRDAQGRTNISQGNEMHHIVPIREGGTSTAENLILLCPNHHKQADWGIITPEELKRFQRKARTNEERQKAIRNAMQHYRLRDWEEEKQLSMFEE